MSIAGNIMTFFDSGNFETDPSTWGRNANTSFYTLTRSSLYKTKNFYSGKSVIDAVDGGGITDLATFTLNLIAGFNYTITCQVRIDSATNNSSGTAVLGLYQNLMVATGGDLNFISNVNKTITQATNTWVEIELVFNCTNTAAYVFDLIVATVNDAIFSFNGSGTVNVSDDFYVDDICALQDAAVVGSLDLNFDRIAFSKNDIYHSTTEDGGLSGNDGYAIQSRVVINKWNGTIIEIIDAVESRLTPDENGEAIFRVNKIADSYLSHSHPEHLDITIKRYFTSSGIAKLFHGHTYIGMVGNISHTSDENVLVLKGAVRTVDFIGVDFFVDVLPVTKQFLTWKGLENNVNVLQPEYLYFISIEDISHQIKLIVNITYEDTTTHNAELLVTDVDFITTAQLIKGIVWQIPAGVDQLGIDTIDPGKIISKYTLHLTNEFDTVVSETRTYNVSQCPEANTQYFLYNNSLGGYDTLITTGKKSLTVDVSKEDFENILPVNYTLADKQSSTFNHQSQDVYTVSTGFISKDEANRIAHELLMAEDVRIVIGTERVPVVIDTRSSLVFEDDTLLYFVRFSFRIAYKDFGYSEGI